MDNSPTDNARNLADETIGHLLRHPSPQQRYEALDILASRLTWLRALTAKQLETDLGSVAAAAAALGISRQAITELYTKTGTPTPRADRQRPSRAAYQYGRWLAAAEHAARLAGPRHLGHCDKLMGNATATTTVQPALARYAQQWLTAAGRRAKHGGQVGEVRDVLAAPDAVEAIRELGCRYLTVAEQADVWVGLHHARHAAGWLA
jgi:hypothetical protein